MRDYLEPLCSSEVHSALIIQTDYVLAETGQSSEDYDEEEGDIQNHSDKYQIWEEGYSLFALNSSYSFI